MKRIFIISFALVLISCKKTIEKEIPNETTQENSLILEGEKHFKSLKQLTFGGDNAEAYWSFDDKQIVFQSNNKEWGVECDQMFLMNIDETFENKIPPMVSTGKG